MRSPAVSGAVRWLSLVAAGLAIALGSARPVLAAECLPLTATLPDGNLIVPGTRGGVVYAAADARRPVPLLMDVYAPGSSPSGAFVLVVHGGGWTSGSRVAHVGQLLELLTDAGFRWGAIDYRQRGIDRWREAVDDVRAAVEFVRCHAAALGADPARVVLLGEDAGAQLVAHAAVDSGAAAAILLGGFYDLTTTGALAERAPAEILREASLLGADGPRVSLRTPVYVVHGGDDTEAPAHQAEAFCERLNARGGRCELDVVPGAIHRSENWRPSQWEYKSRLVGWLRRTVGGSGDPGLLRPASHAADGPLAPGLHKKIVYQPRANLTLDAWLPASPGPHVPVLLVHGGGWEAGDRVTYLTPLFRPLADAGLAWFSIDYRLTPDARHEAQLQDVRDAIAFIRARAAAFNVDARKLVLAGESASAQMVALIATEDHALAGVVAFYGVYDFFPFAERISPRSPVARLFGVDEPVSDEERDVLRRYSPIHRAVKGQPPMLLVHGTAENLWAQGRAYADRLRQIGAPHELYPLEGAPHGMENWEGHPDWEAYKKKVVAWIRDVTR